MFVIKKKNISSGKRFFIHTKTHLFTIINMLFISYQFILVKIKQNAFFSVGIRTYLSLT